MAQPDLNITTALEAIAEGMNILQLLACATDKTQWIDDSVPLSKLNELAQSLGYRDAQSVHSQVESDRDLDECHAEIRGLWQERVSIYQALDKCQVPRDYDDGKPASIRVRVLWLNERAEEVETLAQLVTEETAELLERLAGGACVLASKYTFAERGLSALQHEDEKAARNLAAQIREVLDEH